jgi:hypothetical protein
LSDQAHTAKSAARVPAQAKVEPRASADPAAGPQSRNAPRLPSAEDRQANFRAGVAGRNDTGLPDRLKAGIESLSGFSMDDVRVHYASSKPAQLEALAYAQGSNIYVAPGEERHLPHEAWHVVQQKRGRLRATTQSRGAAVNDDPGLEREADVLGARALGSGPAACAPARGAIGAPAAGLTQRVVVVGDKKYSKAGGRADRRKRKRSGGEPDLSPAGGSAAAASEAASHEPSMGEIAPEVPGAFQLLEDVRIALERMQFGLTNAARMELKRRVGSDEEFDFASISHLIEDLFRRNLLEPVNRGETMGPTSLGKRPVWQGAAAAMRSDQEQFGGFDLRHTISSSTIGKGIEKSPATNKQLASSIAEFGGGTRSVGEGQAAIRQAKKQLWQLAHNHPANLFMGEPETNRAAGLIRGPLRRVIVTIKKRAAESARAAQSAVAADGSSSSSSAAPAPLGLVRLGEVLELLPRDPAMGAANAFAWNTIIEVLEAVLTAKSWEGLLSVEAMEVAIEEVIASCDLDLPGYEGGEEGSEGESEEEEEEEEEDGNVSADERMSPDENDGSVSDRESEREDEELEDRDEGERGERLIGPDTSEEEASEDESEDESPQALSPAEYFARVSAIREGLTSGKPLYGKSGLLHSYWKLVRPGGGLVRNDRPPRKGEPVQESGAASSSTAATGQRSKKQMATERRRRQGEAKAARLSGEQAERPLYRRLTETRNAMAHGMELGAKGRFLAETLALAQQSAALPPGPLAEATAEAFVRHFAEIKERIAGAPATRAAEFQPSDDDSGESDSAGSSGKFDSEDSSDGSDVSFKRRKRDAESHAGIASEPERLDPGGSEAPALSPGPEWRRVNVSGAGLNCLIRSFLVAAGNPAYARGDPGDLIVQLRAHIDELPGGMPGDMLDLAEVAGAFLIGQIAPLRGVVVYRPGQPPETVIDNPNPINLWLDRGHFQAIIRR